MMYTCCLAYADEDEGMAQIITDLYTKASPDTLFFRPQWDLKRGKYEYETTARVIEERCGGKILFLISEYFLASNVCRFAANFAINLNPEGDKGRLVPFLLTDNYAHIPTALRGITGIKWHNTWTRPTAWTNLPEAFYKCDSSTDLQEVKDRLKQEVQSDKDRYLGDPPYDKDIEPPREPVFSSDSEECRAPSIENLEGEYLLPKTRMDKLKSWSSKKWNRITKRFRRRHGRDFTSVNSACESSEQGSNNTSVCDLSSRRSSIVLLGESNSSEKK